MYNFLNYHTWELYKSYKIDLAIYIKLHAPFSLVKVSAYDYFPPMWHVEENKHFPI